MNCPFCRKYFSKKQRAVDHINQFHQNELEQTGRNAEQELYFFTHHTIHGVCMCGCGRATEWNYKTGKPYKVSTNPECRSRLYQRADQNMMNARNMHVHSLLDDMEHQKAMQSHRPTYSKYRFPDGGEVGYLSKLERGFLTFCDKIMEFTSNMIQESPEVFKYYDSKTRRWRQYIPDYYLPDYNLLVEIKDGGAVKNTNPAFVRETQYKIAMKDAVMLEQDKYNYIRISGSNYGPFVEMLYQIVHEQKPDTKSHGTLYHISETACTL